MNLKILNRHKNNAKLKRSNNNVQKAELNDMQEADFMFIIANYC